MAKVRPLILQAEPLRAAQWALCCLWFCLSTPSPLAPGPGPVGGALALRSCLEHSDNVRMLPCVLGSYPLPGCFWCSVECLWVQGPLVLCSPFWVTVSPGSCFGLGGPLSFLLPPSCRPRPQQPRGPPAPGSPSGAHSLLLQLVCEDVNVDRFYPVLYPKVWLNLGPAH